MTRHQFVRMGSTLLLVALLFLGVAIHTQAATTTSNVQQATVDPEIPVALSPGGAKQYYIASTLSLPTRPTSTIIVTYHGSTYGQYYWDFPYQPSTYSFVDAMTKAGYAVLNIDRIGDGQSSHPASNLITIASDAYTLHQVVQDLREGAIDHRTFTKVVLAAHSLGGYVSLYAASLYAADFDGLIETGVSHHLSTLPDPLAARYYLATDDPKFQASGLDDGYFTTRPGMRSKIYYHQVPTTDPNVAALDEQLKQTTVLSELIAGLASAPTHTSNMIHVPVLSVLGQYDYFSCQAGGMDCSRAATIKQAEAPFYSADACLQTYDLANAGHDINLAPNAQEWYSAAASWMNSFVEHQQPGCGTRPQSVPLAQLATVSIPGTPASNWCYDTAVIDDNTYYLADNDRAGIDVIHDGNQPAYQGSIGNGQFTGIGGCKSGNYDTNGPEGLIVTHDQIYAGDGNSSVRVYSSETGQFLTRIATGGHLRADEMTYDARDHMVIVANGSERDFSPSADPFISFISTRPGPTFDHIVKTLPFPHAEALEQPMWNPYDGKLYVAVTSSDNNPGGEVDVIDPTTLKIVTTIATPACGDAGLAIASREIMAVGCGNGDQIALNLETQRITRIPITSVDIVAASKHFLYYASYGSDTQAPQLAVADLQGHLLQTIPIAATSHTVSINVENGHVFVPLDGGQVAIFQQNQQAFN